MLRESPDEHRGTGKEARPQARGRLLGLDLGARRVGVALSDETRTVVRSLPFLGRTSWKRLLVEISGLCRAYDVRGLVVGLPLRLDGTEGDAAKEARRIARNLELSLGLPVSLQDERLTSKVAEENLRAAGAVRREIDKHVDGEAAALILSDFLAGGEPENSAGESSVNDSVTNEFQG
jgi:putative Holliday junction resolvase